MGKTKSRIKRGRRESGQEQTIDQVAYIFAEQLFLLAGIQSTSGPKLVVILTVIHLTKTARVSK